MVGKKKIVEKVPNNQITKNQNTASKTTPLRKKPNILPIEKKHNLLPHLTLKGEKEKEILIKIDLTHKNFVLLLTLRLQTVLKILKDQSILKVQKVCNYILLRVKEKSLV